MAKYKVFVTDAYYICRKDKDGDMVCDWANDVDKGDEEEKITELQDLIDFLQKTN